MSLRLPNANSVQEFSDNLYNKANCTTDVTARYGHSVHNEIPKFMGLLKSVNEFDAGFFGNIQNFGKRNNSYKNFAGISAKESHYMDPMCRIVLECTYEAILDAGMSPSDFEGKKTVIYIGASTFENENLFYSGEVPKGTCCIVEYVTSYNAQGTIFNRFPCFQISPIRDRRKVKLLVENHWKNASSW